MEETKREQLKERRRLANKKYRETHKEKMRELIKKHYWENIDNPEFKQKLKDKAKRYRDKQAKRVEKNNEPEFILITLET